MKEKKKNDKRKLVLVRCIRQFREKRKIGKRELSRAMGMSEDWAQRFENGKQARLDVIELLDLAAILKFNPGKCINRLRRARDCHS